MTVPVQIFPDSAAWADACAARLLETLGAAARDNGRAVFAGSGGSTPAPIYERMARAGDVHWDRVIATLIDERYVPETSPDSNAALLKHTLLTGPAAAAAFVPLYSAAVTVDRAAAEATKALRSLGRLDAVLLGMGEDGHICSMFPRSPTLKTLLTPTLPPAVLGVPPGRDGDPPSIERLSINLPYLAQAGRVVLAITGKQKRAVYELEAEGDLALHPIAALIAAKAPLEVLWTESAR